MKRKQQSLFCMNYFYRHLELALDISWIIPWMLPREFLNKFYVYYGKNALTIITIYLELPQIESTIHIQSRLYTNT